MSSHSHIGTHTSRKRTLCFFPQYSVHFTQCCAWFESCCVALENAHRIQCTQVQNKLPSLRTGIFIAMLSRSRNSRDTELLSTKNGYGKIRHLLNLQNSSGLSINSCHPSRTEKLILFISCFRQKRTDERA